MKTPDEIKLGLECCQTEMTTKYKVCGKCGYFSDGFGCENILMKDALAYIQQLERERDAAVEDLHGLCSVCKHNNTKVCDSCTHTASIFEVYGDADNWEWRGLEDAEKRRSVSQADF